MRRLLLFSIGLPLLLPLRAAAQESTDAPNIYEQIHLQERRRAAATQVAPRIATYVANILPSTQLNIPPGDVPAALQSDRNVVCAPDNNDGEKATEQECQSTIRFTKELTKNTRWLHNTLRDLQLAATNYELGTNPYGGNATAVLSRLPSITNLWYSQSDALENPVRETRLRSMPYPPRAMNRLEGITRTLQNLITRNEAGRENREKFIAAVWRYRHGVRSAGSPCSPGSNERNNRGDGTELQFLTARFCGLENRLRALHDQLPKTVSPPLSTNETLVYPVQKLEGLPVLVWATHEDIGLMWHTQLEPVLPSMNCSESHSYAQPEGMCDDGVVLGGTYPDPPAEPAADEGLCSHPMAKRGYLCRAMQNARCPDYDADGINDVLLTECNAPQFDTAPIAFTDSGPNICSAGGWRRGEGTLPDDSPDEDEDLEPQKCSNCVADLVCQDECPAGVAVKDENGRIQACVEEDSGALATYLVLAQLTHVRQQCNAPPGEDSIWQQKYNTINGCCAAEYQAFTTACNALADDGVLQAVGLDVTACAAVFANQQCGQVYGSPADAGICGDTGIAMPDEEVIATLQQYTDDHADELDIAPDCAAAVNNLDRRAQDMKYSYPNVCHPDCRTQYTNTIGNNACYIGQCVEESLEENRLLPGRVNWTTQDPAFPWDPLRGEPTNAVPTLAPPATATLPPYRPLHYVRQLDEAICQTYGMPVRTPPTLCAFDVRRSLNLPSNAPGMFALGISHQGNETEKPQDALRDVAPAIGARLGSALYSQYFRSAVLSLRSTVTNANAILRTLEEASFPTEMCPLNATNTP